MVITTLTSELIAEGRRLLDELEAREIDVDAAVWFWMEDREAWWLLLSLPREAPRGPLHCHLAVQEALKASGAQDLTLLDFSVGLQAQKIIRELRTRVRVDGDDRPRRMSGTRVGDCRVHDALVYRMRPPRRNRAAKKAS